jgi:hypothetical protein
VRESTVGKQQQIHAPDVRIGRLAERQWGVLSAGELRECGLSDHAIAARARRGWLHKVHRGVYAVGHGGLTMRGRFLAAVKACGDGAVLSHFSAAALWELVPYNPERKPDVTARHAKRIPAVTTHRSNRPPPSIRYDRIPVTTPARTLADLSSMLPFKPLRRAVREALIRKRITPREAAAILRTTPAPTRSDLEDLVLDLIKQAGFAPPHVNEPLSNGYIPDFRWPDQRLILEADGQAWHDDPVSRHQDAERQARLEQDGERVLRVAYAQITQQREQTIERLRQAGAPLRGSPGTGPAPRASPARGSPPTPAA